MGRAALLNRSPSSKIHNCFWHIYTSSNIFILYQKYLLAKHSFQALLQRDKDLQRDKIYTNSLERKSGDCLSQQWSAGNKIIAPRAAYGPQVGNLCCIKLKLISGYSKFKCTASANSRALALR